MTPGSHRNLLGPAQNTVILTNEQGLDRTEPGSVKLGGHSLCPNSGSATALSQFKNGKCKGDSFSVAMSGRGTERCSKPPTQLNNMGREPLKDRYSVTSCVACVALRTTVTTSTPQQRDRHVGNWRLLGPGKGLLSGGMRLPWLQA